MSQEKVELRKSQKGNTKANVKKEKRNRFLVTIILSVVAVAVIVWIALSIIFGMKNSSENKEKQVNLDSIQTYMQELDAEDGSTDTEAE